MYTTIDYPSGTKVRQAFKEGKKIRVYNPNPIGPYHVPNGPNVIEGPHYPKPRRFCLHVIIEDGAIVKIL